ncbi:MAG: CopG family transcriptional regulator [Chromatiales bacterium]|jgi:hypothetical protein|nr:CopG family transcriptional regulator [Chromatiales bacterium]
MVKSEVKQPPTSVRASISFPRDHYELIERIAAEKKVSVAWVVRDAVEAYLGGRWPLLGGGPND